MICESAFWTPCTEVINLPSSQYVMGLAGVSGAGSSWNLLYILDEISRPKILISWMKESFFEHCPKEAKWSFNHSIKGNLQKYHACQMLQSIDDKGDIKLRHPNIEQGFPFWYWMGPAVCGRSLIPSKLSHNCQPEFNVVRSLAQYMVYRCCGLHLHTNSKAQHRVSSLLLQTGFSVTACLPISFRSSYKGLPGCLPNTFKIEKHFNKLIAGT